MFDPRNLTHHQLAAIVSDVQAILWKESRMRPDDPRQMSDYWNPGKEFDCEAIEEIAEVLDEAGLRPPDYMPVDEHVVAPPAIDANELLWAARIFATLARLHRNVIPLMRDNLKLARAILQSYADLPDFDPRDQRWTIAR